MAGSADLALPGPRRRREPRTSSPERRRGELSNATAEHDGGIVNGRRSHTWRRGWCTTCGLREHETSVLDDEGWVVVALYWVSPFDRVIRVRPFPYLLGTTAPSGPVNSVSERFPGVPIGPMPVCPGSHSGWATNPGEPAW